MARYRTTKQPKQTPKPNLLPLWLALAGLGLILAAVWAVNAGSRSKAGIEVEGAPRLKVETDRIDRGDVQLGTPVRDEIRITNVGDQPLRFAEAPYVEVKEGC